MSDQLNLYELISLTISERQLFDCNSNVISSDKCIDSIDKKIYANNNFVICFELFGNNGSIYLDNKDFVEICIDKEKRGNILQLHTTTDKTQKVICDNFKMKVLQDLNLLCSISKESRKFEVKL